MKNQNVYDVIAIGLGPFNLGFACLAEPIEDLKCLVLEQKSSFDWHPGMMLESAHLQTPFMADLVTLANPTSPYSFLNYIKQQGRLYSFYIKESFFLMRREFNQYCQWAANRLGNVRFNSQVTHISRCSTSVIYQLEVIQDGTLTQLHARQLILGTGPSPYIPNSCANLVKSETILHSSNYMHQKSNLQNQNAITIVGSGQSAAEIFYDLLQDIDTQDYQLNWITRSARFSPLEYSKLTLEMTSPEYVDYFHNLPATKRDELINKQTYLYKGINSELINDIFDCLYVKRLAGDLNINILTNCEVTGARTIGTGAQTELEFTQVEQDCHFKIQSDAVVFATGYRYQLPQFLEGLVDHIRWDHKGRFDVARNYSIDSDNSLFVQNAELHTHGFVTPDLGMAAYRNSILLKEITGVEHYPIETQIAFQQFDLSEFTQTQSGIVDQQESTPA